MRIGITGASGYVGRSVVDAAVRRGHEVVVLGRSPSASNEFRRFDLQEEVPVTLLANLDALIHLAAETGGRAGSDAELKAARQLAGLAAGGGVRMLFVSSQAASSSAPSAYGRLKAAIEGEVLAVGAVARLGMVYGGRPMGLWWWLAGTAARMPFVPAFLPPPVVQPVHVCDAAAAILAAVEHGAVGVRWRVAGPPVRFERFLEQVAVRRGRKHVVPLPIPLGLARWALRVAARNARGKQMQERFESLVALRTMDCEQDLARLGVCLRSLHEGASKSGRAWRPLLEEGTLLARAHVPGARPGMAIRRYVHSLQATEARAVALPGLRPLRHQPSLVASLLSRPPFHLGGGSAVAGRARVALAVLESTPRYVGAFLCGKDESALTLVRDVVMSVLMATRAIVLFPLAKRLYARGERSD